MFEYRMMPAPGASKKAKGLKTIHERFAHALTEALNTEAKNGWEFVGQEAFSVEEKVGMMKKPKTSDLTFLVFRRAVVTDALPLDQKLEHLRNQRSRTMLQPAIAPAAAAAAVIPAFAQTNVVAEEPAVLSPPEPVSEPFPEPMPAYVPEQIVEPNPESIEESIAGAIAQEIENSSSLPYPGPAPEPTLGMPEKLTVVDNGGPTLNYDHSKSGNGASVDTPILGPARRD